MVRLPRASNICQALADAFRKAVPRPLFLIQAGNNRLKTQTDRNTSAKITFGVNNMKGRGRVSTHRKETMEYKMQ